MFLRKVNGPRTVTLPDGTTISRADLPPPNTLRWVASRKAAVVRGVAAGLIEREEALQLYGLSGDELDSWQNAVETHGEAALKTTSLQKFRD
jgi:hypothetical protein